MVSLLDDQIPQDVLVGLIDVGAFRAALAKMQPHIQQITFEGLDLEESVVSRSTLFEASLKLNDDELRAWLLFGASEPGSAPLSASSLQRLLDEPRYVCAVLHASLLAPMVEDFDSVAAIAALSADQRRAVAVVDRFHEEDVKRFIATMEIPLPRTLRNIREYFVATGAHWWPIVFKGYNPDDVFEAYTRLQKYVGDYKQQLHVTDLSGQAKLGGWKYLAATVATEYGATLIVQSARWNHFGRPLVRISQERLAAAMMSTSVPHIDFRLPWNATLIEIPRGLLLTSVQGFEETICHVLAHSSPGLLEDGTVVPLFGFHAITEYGTSLHSFRKSLRYLQEQSEDESRDTYVEGSLDMPLTSRDDRTITVIWRLIASTCLMMSDPDHDPRLKRRSGGKPDTSLSKRMAAPKCMYFELRHDITVDCRDGLEGFLAGRRRSTTAVQWLVRGHWRNQACGPKMVDRRPKSIEPYWKGAEDGPVALRAHVVATNNPLLYNCCLPEPRWEKEER